MASASSNQFQTELKTVADWYVFGSYLGVELHDLDDIKRFESQGAGRCRVEVYKKYKELHGPPLWNIIVKALIKMEKLTLAEEIRKKYVSSQQLALQESPNMSDSTLGCQQSARISQPQVIVRDKVKRDLERICRKYSALLISVKRSLEDKKVRIDELQSIVQDYGGQYPLLSQPATLNEAFEGMKQKVHIYDVFLLETVIEVLIKDDAVTQELRNYMKMLEDFKSSTLMQDIVESIVEKSNAASGGAVPVVLKVSGAWQSTTIREFEMLVSVALHDITLTDIKVEIGCLCVTWTTTRRKAGRYIHMYEQQKSIKHRYRPRIRMSELGHDIYSFDFSTSADIVGILLLIVGDEEIYRRQDQSDTPVSLDSALLQAIEKGVIDAVELLLAVGANPYLSLPSGDTVIGVAGKMMDDGGNTILHKACWYGHCDLVSLLLAEGFDPNKAGNYKGFTPLAMACHRGNFKLVSILLSAGADVMINQKILLTTLTTACKSGNSELVSTLLKAGVDIKESVMFGASPLTAACEKGHSDIVSNLLSAGANVNQGDPSPLIAACEKGHSDIASNLLSAGADVNQGDPTILTAAFENGNAKLVSKALFKAGVDIDINKSGTYKVHGTTPLIAACENGNAELVSTLLKAGADANKSSIYGMTPLKAACERGHSDIVSNLLSAGADVNRVDPTLLDLRAVFENDTELYFTLLEAGFDIYKIKSGTYGTRLTAACENGNAELVSTLLRAGADINKSDSYGTTPLMAACRKGHSVLVSNLLSAGADANQGDPTPLTAACENGNLELVSTLLNAGADINKSGRYGTTPLMAACRKGHSVIVSNLLSAGAHVNKGDLADFNKANENNKTPSELAYKQEVEYQLMMAHFMISKYELARACLNDRRHTAVSCLEHNPDPNIAFGISSPFLQEYKLDLKNTTTVTPLILACHENNTDIAETLLRHGAGVNVTTDTGLTPLMVASEKGHVMVVRLLLKWEANPDMTHSNGQTALDMAQENKHQLVVEDIAAHKLSMDKQKH